MTATLGKTVVPEPETIDEALRVILTLSASIDAGREVIEKQKAEITKLGARVSALEHLVDAKRPTIDHDKTRTLESILRKLKNGKTGAALDDLGHFLTRHDPGGAVRGAVVTAAALL